MRRLSFLLLSLLFAAGTTSAQDLLVNTRLQPTEIVDPEEVFILDLHDYFQRYNSPGPVATFVIPMPEPAGERDLFVENKTDNGKPLRDKDGYRVPVFDEDGVTVRIPTFELKKGGEYQNIWEVKGAENFVWNEYELRYRMLADQAPATIANFLTYVDRGAYNNTIVHRNEANNHRFTANGFLDDIKTPLPIVQAGGWRLYDGEEDYILETINTLPAIPFEAGGEHAVATLAMARTNFLDSATSQFFFNVEDNTDTFSSSTEGRNPFTVFAEPMDPEVAEDVMTKFATAPIHDMTYIYSSLPFQTIPMYTPIWDDQDSYARIAEIRVEEGDPAGISHGWAFADTAEGEEPSEEVLANRAAFNIEIVGNELRISRTSTGVTTIEVTGETADGQRADFTVNLAGYDEAALDLFPDSLIDLEGWLDSSWYGFLKADGTLPFLAHVNHGNQFVHPDSSGEFFLAYDFGLNSWLYTTRGLYPFLYNYRLGTWLWYSEGTGNGLDADRWFFRFPSGEGEGEWVQEPALLPAG